MKRALIIMASAMAASAQPTVAPTPERVGNPRGEDNNGYNIVQSFETGYRFHTVNGNLGKYRSDVNFGNGIRLLGSNFSVHSKEGQGRYFDEIVLSTQGLGNDPYQSATFRAQKNRLYRYDLIWRQNDYYNPALPIAGGVHFMDTSRMLQSHDLILLPQSKLKVIAGYSRNRQTGPALSTVNLFDQHRGDVFPYFADIRRTQDEYRIGGELEILGSKLHFVRSWEFFKEDTPYSLNSLSQGRNPTDPATLTSFQRAEPYHGSTGSWRVALFGERRLFAWNGRFTYAGSERQFIFDERAVGTDRLGAARNRQVLVFGTGRRPVEAANFTFSIFPSEQLTIANHTAFHNTRMEGDGTYREIDNATLFANTVNFQFLGVRAFTNSTDLNWRPNPVFGLFTGYRFTDREIRSVELVEFAGAPERVSAEHTNRLHAGMLGLRFRPVQRLTINLDGEVGRADRPFSPISERNYHALGARLQYKTRTSVFSVYGRTNYNFNSISLSSHSAKARTYAVDYTWTPRTSFSLDAGYSKQHLDTATGIVYFAAGRREGSSVYISNIHAANVGVRFSLMRKAELYFGYSRVQDTGEEGPVPLVSGSTPAEIAQGVFNRVRAFPVIFESPQARLSIPVHLKVRLNGGYQFYRYREEQPIEAIQDYRAHTGFVSLLWSF